MHDKLNSIQRIKTEFTYNNSKYERRNETDFLSMISFYNHAL